MSEVWQHETTGEIVGRETIERMGEAGYVRLVPARVTEAMVEAARRSVLYHAATDGTMRRALEAAMEAAR